MAGAGVGNPATRTSWKRLHAGRRKGGMMPKRFYLEWPVADDDDDSVDDNDGGYRDGTEIG